MNEEKKGFLTIGEIPSSSDEQAIIAFFSRFMSSSSRAMVSDIMRQAHCVLMESVPVGVGEIFVRQLRGLGAHVVFSTVEADLPPKNWSRFCDSFLR